MWIKLEWEKDNVPLIKLSMLDLQDDSDAHSGLVLVSFIADSTAPNSYGTDSTTSIREALKSCL